MDFFDRVKEQRNSSKTVKAQTAAALGRASAMATSVFVGPVAAGVVILPAFGVFKGGLDLATLDFSKCDPQLIAFQPFSPAAPRLTYGLNPFSSGTWGSFKGLFVDNPSKTYGFVKLELDQAYYFLFNLNKPEPLSPGVVWKMMEYLQKGLKEGLLTFAELRQIQKTLQTASLPNISQPHPKLLSLKTGPYLTSLILENLLEKMNSSTVTEREKFAARKLVETEIASNLATVWPETVNQLEKIVKK